MTELSKLLTFMYEDDRLTALAMYNEMLDEAQDEAELIKMLGSPTRQAVVIAHAYDSSRLPAEQNEDEEPEFIKTIDELRAKAIDKGLIVESYEPDYADEGDYPELSDYPEDGEYPEAEAYDGTAEYTGEVELPEYESSELAAYAEELGLNDEPVYLEDGEMSEQPVYPELDGEAEPVTAEEKNGEYRMDIFQALYAAVSAPDDELPSEPETVSEELAVTEQTSEIEDFISDIQLSAEGIESAGISTEPSPEDGENAAEAAASGSANDVAEAAVKAAEAAAKVAEAAAKVAEAAAKTPESAKPEKIDFFKEPLTDEAPIVEAEEAKPVAMVRKAKPVLLALYIILAVPITLAGVAVLFAPTITFLALAAVTIGAGINAVAAVFSGFAVVADRLLVLGLALIVCAVALFLFWLFIWFTVDVLIGFVAAVIRLGRKWCYKEVPVE